MTKLRLLTTPSVLPVAALVLTVPACVPDPGRADRTAEEYLRLSDAEDARPEDGPLLSVLVNALERREPLLRRTAVRALGRLERPELLDEIAGPLEDPAASVRAAAALALAQSVRGSPGGTALPALLGRVHEETDPTARGALAWALGRLELGSSDRARAVEAIVALGRKGSAGQDPPTETLLGVALGLEALLARGEEAGVGPDAAERLEELLVYRREDLADADAARVRALAAAALGAARRMTLELVLSALEDPDAEVRRQAVRHLDAVVPSRRNELLGRALRDSSDRVQIEAIRFLAARTRTEPACAMLSAAAGPEGLPTVRIEALAALGSPCPGPGQVALLREAAAALGNDRVSWLPAAQALRSLVRIDPAGAGRLLGPYVTHPDPVVRVRAAEVAAALRDRQTLGTLGVDESANVRNAAVQGLFAIEGHAIDPLLHAHLQSSDPQLLLTAAQLLEGSPDASGSAAAALDAFERASATARETLRDTRLALLERVAELGGPELADRLLPYLRDYDPVVARQVARVLLGWSGETHIAEARPLPRAPLPSVEELAALEETTVVLHLRGLGRIVVRPLPGVALTNAHRFVRLAERGYYDGLTFHRRAPNFVIQGGSPGANEYAGDGPFTRDEIGNVAHWRGTVGLSTRGRDTGDGQIFVNLVHNTRLDPDYTVLGVVVEGMDVVDRVLEGTVIERVEVRRGI